MKPNNQPCAICGLPSTLTIIEDTHLHECIRCGEFKITGTAAACLPGILGADAVTRFDLSSFLSENRGILITSENIRSLIPANRPTVMERARRTLALFARRNPEQGRTVNIAFSYIDYLLQEQLRSTHDLRDDIRITITESCTLMAAAWARTSTELEFLMMNVLTKTQKFLSCEASAGFYDFTITGEGWNFLESSGANNDTKDAFVAMSFNDGLIRVYEEAIKPGIEDAGYNPVRIDRTEHVNRIDDEIIALIRRSRFIVADFTQHKCGVYFEAGFALGLGTPVIWMCREDDLTNSHFDTRQYNAIVWRDGEFEDARRRIAIRIEAVVGRQEQQRKRS